MKSVAAVIPVGPESETCRRGSIISVTSPEETIHACMACPFFNDASHEAKIVFWPEDIF